MKHFKFLEKPKRTDNHEKKIESCALHNQYQRVFRSPLAAASFHIVDRPFKAHLNVFFTEKMWEADLLVYVSELANHALGRDEVWHYTDNESFADTLVYPVEKPFMADLKVCLVKNEYQARWLKKKKLVKRH